VTPGPRTVQDGSGPFGSPHLPDAVPKARKPFWTTSKYGLQTRWLIDMSFIAGRWLVLSVP
jgi:hypothetical protein